MKNRMNILRIILLCFILLSGHLKGQKIVSTEKFVSGIGNYENIFLVTDRNVYIAGENIWFNADYFINGVFPEQKQSNILYLELFDDAGTVVAKGKYSLSNNKTSGAIKIPDDIRSGIYIMRVYTRYQRNFPAEAITSIPVVIVNPMLPPMKENDSFINNKQPSEKNKKSESIVITDETEDIIYLIADSSGYSDEKVSYILRIFSGNLNPVWENKLQNSKKYKVRIQKKESLDGLNYFVLYDAYGEIKDISAFYILNDNPNEVSLSLKDSVFSIREPVETEINPEFKVTDDCFVSVAVVKHGTYFPGINNSLPDVYIKNPWLLKDLPSVYSKSPAIKQQIDSALVLYHDYLNTPAFYQKINSLSSCKMKYIPDVREVSLSGVILDKRTDMPVGGVPVYLSVLFDNPQLHIQKTKADGEFIFSLNGLSDVQDVYICPAVQDSVKTKILVEQDFMTDYPHIVHVRFPFTINDKSFLEELYLNFQLNDEFSTEKKPEQSIYPIKENKTFGDIIHKTVLADFITLKTINEVFTEIVPNVKIRKKDQNYYFQVLNELNQELPGQPLTLIDNVPVFNINILLDMHPAQIEKIEVVNKVYVLGDHAFNGIIMITTKTENFAGLQLPDEAVFMEYQTISKEKELYQKLYPSEIEKESRIPDLRNMLYWNPNVTIESKRTKITFYTSDCEGNYDIIVRGYSSDGKPFSGIRKINVRK